MEHIESLSRKLQKYAKKVKELTTKKESLHNQLAKLDEELTELQALQLTTQQDFDESSATHFNTHGASHLGGHPEDLADFMDDDDSD